MSERPTPETDVAQFGTGRVSVDFARKLERERDEARAERDILRSNKMSDPLLETTFKHLIRERDEAREQLEREQMRLAACDVVAMSDTESSRGKARDIHENYWSAAVESVIRRVDECIELRKQLEAAHAVLDADPSKIIRNAKDGYPEGRESQELTLAERVKALCIYAADWKRWCVEAGERSEAMREGIGVAYESLNVSTTFGTTPKQDQALTKLQPFLP
jgi:hypothetical protein